MYKSLFVLLVLAGCTQSTETLKLGVHYDEALVVCDSALETRPLQPIHDPATIDVKSCSYQLFHLTEALKAKQIREAH